jgi:hypothetical protein
VCIYLCVCLLTLLPVIQHFVYIYICVCMFVCEKTCVCISLWGGHREVGACVDVGVGVGVYVRRSTCLNVSSPHTRHALLLQRMPSHCPHTHNTHTHIYIYIYIYIYINTHTHTYIYISQHTKHTHTHIYKYTAPSSLPPGSHTPLPMRSMPTLR